MFLDATRTIVKVQSSTVPSVASLYILSSCLPVCYRSSFILLSSFSRRTQTRCNVSFLSYLKWCNVDVSLLLVPYYGLEDVLKYCFRLILMSLTDHFPWHGTVRHLISLLFFLRRQFLMLTTLSSLIGLTCDVIESSKYVFTVRFVILS